MTDLDYVIVSEAAKVAGVSTTHIIRLINKGDLDARNLNNRLYLISRKSFNHWLANRKPAGRPKAIKSTE